MLYCEKNGCICTFRPSFGAVVARAQLSPMGPAFKSPSVWLVWGSGKNWLKFFTNVRFEFMARSPYNTFDRSRPLVLTRNELISQHDCYVLST